MGRLAESNLGICRFRFPFSFLIYLGGRYISPRPLPALSAQAAKRPPTRQRGRATFNLLPRTCQWLPLYQGERTRGRLELIKRRERVNRVGIVMRVPPTAYQRHASAPNSSTCTLPRLCLSLLCIGVNERGCDRVTDDLLGSAPLRLKGPGFLRSFSTVTFGFRCNPMIRANARITLDHHPRPFRLNLRF